MPVFPQLTTGCLSQYPLLKRIVPRSIYNETLDGRRVTLADSGAGRAEWELHYEGLTQTEAEALRTLFEEVEGSLGEFLFLDPTGNLLAYSEELGRAPWTAGPLLGWTANIADPFGGTRAGRLVNTSQTDQAIEQTAEIPANYLYCLSFYLRSAAPVMLRAGWHKGSSALSEAVAANAGWKRVFVSGSLETDDTGVTFRIELPAGAVVDIFGVQAEAQREPSGYRRTYDRSGGYPNAHFLDDELALVADGWNNYAANVRIGSAWRK